MFGSKCCLIAFVGLMLTAGPAMANGALASFGAGGVEFKDADAIAMTQEDLYLSSDAVRVHYLFTSGQAKAQSVTMGFPLPKVPAEADTPDSITLNDNAAIDPRNYLNFQVSVNGKPVTPELHDYAWLNGRDVTARVVQAGMKLLPSFEEQDALRLDPKLRSELIAEGLVYGTADSDTVYPLWEYQVVFGWQQDFAPGKTEVDISYRPLMGYPGDFGDSYEVGEHADSACVDDGIRSAIAKRKAVGSYYEVGQLDYIVTTAKHWSGPIGTFNLTVSKYQPDEGGDTVYYPPEQVLVAACPPDLKKVSDTDFVWSAKNYVPKKDLRVFFYYFQTP